VLAGTFHKKENVDRREYRSRTGPDDLYWKEEIDTDAERGRKKKQGRNFASLLLYYILAKHAHALQQEKKAIKRFVY
jgi:hypothetical protein